MDNCIFNGGISTDIEVRKLEVAFPHSKVGDIFEDDEISVIIGEPVGSNRYKTIVTRWRKKMFNERHVRIARLRKAHYYVANSQQNNEAAADEMGSITNKIRKTRKILAITNRDELDTHNQVRYDKLCAVATKQTEYLFIAARSPKPLPPKPTAKNSRNNAVI